jgi:hypothetical protein
MVVVFWLVALALLALLWALARRGETKKLQRLGALDADALRRGNRARDQAWSGQYRADGRYGGGGQDAGHLGGPGF